LKVDGNSALCENTNLNRNEIAVEVVIRKEMWLQVMALRKASMTNRSTSCLLQSPLGKYLSKSYQLHKEGLSSSHTCFMPGFTLLGTWSSSHWDECFLSCPLQEAFEDQ
jgi:hypothetical protein